LPVCWATKRVGIWTAEENVPARKLYERAGMTVTGQERCVSFENPTPIRVPPDNEVEDVIRTQR